MSELFLQLCEIMFAEHGLLKDKICSVERDGWKIVFNGTEGQKDGIHHEIFWNRSFVGNSTPSGACLMAGTIDDLIPWVRKQPGVTIGIPAIPA